MSDGRNATDGVRADGAEGADGGRGAGGGLANAALAVCLLLIVGTWVLPEERWTPWWPSPVALIALGTGLLLITSTAPSRRRSIAVGVFALAAAVAWAGLFVLWAGGSAEAADVLDGVGLLGVAAAMVVSWPLLGLPMPSDVRRWWAARRAGVAADPGREGGAGG